VLDLFSEYKKDPSSVNEKWQKFFSDLDVTDLNFVQQTSAPLSNNGHSQSQSKSDSTGSVVKQLPVNMPKPAEGEEAVVIRGAGARIIDNMNNSLSIPTATTFRTIPVKILEENRIIINQHLKNTGRASEKHRQRKNIFHSYYWVGYYKSDWFCSCYDYE